MEEGAFTPEDKTKAAQRAHSGGRESAVPSLCALVLVPASPPSEAPVVGGHLCARGAPGHPSPGCRVLPRIQSLNQPQTVGLHCVAGDQRAQRNPGHI